MRCVSVPRRASRYSTWAPAGTCRAFGPSRPPSERATSSTWCSGQRARSTARRSGPRASGVDGGYDVSISRGRLLLILGIAVHLVFLASLIAPSHFLNPLFIEGTHNLEEGQGSDFYAFYQAGRYVLDGEDIYQRPMDDPDRVVPYAYFYRYLPFVAYTLGVALNALPPRASYWFWVAVVEVVLLLCVLATRRMATDDDLGCSLAAMWLLFSPFYIEQYMGQLTFVMAALTFAFVVTYSRGQTVRAEWSWIASVIVKHLTVLYVPIFVRLRRFRPVLLAGALLILTTVPYFAFRDAGVDQFSHDNFNLSLTPMPGNLGLVSLMMTLKDRFFPGASEPFGSIQGIKLSMTRIMVLVTMLAPLLTGLWVTFRRKPVDLVELVSLWTMTYFMVFREVWEYHYVLMMPVLVLLYARTRARILWLFFALLAIPTPFVFYDVPGPNPQVHWSAFEHVLNHSFKIVPLVGLFIWVAAGYARRHARRLDARPDDGLAVTL
ncbi:MAG: DUF2029 domain-containing protein [Candidatus Eisenbacteria bacterium]|nr:DUF2029 domain-containing protein [Candidatus Eisenbacteria bacterium]